jgi:hypothetical protein
LSSQYYLPSSLILLPVPSKMWFHINQFLNYTDTTFRLYKIFQVLPVLVEWYIGLSPFACLFPDILRKYRVRQANFLFYMNIFRTCLCSSSWRPTRLWDIETPTFSRQSATVRFYVSLTGSPSSPH